MQLQQEIPDIVDCPDPDFMTPHERRVGRIASEEASFNQGHYLADLMDNDYVPALLAFEPSWNSELDKWKANQAARRSNGEVVGVEEPGPDIVHFTAARRDQLKNLQNRSYILDKATKRSLYLGLVDIIFAYAYNFRSTEGEGSVESAWTMCKLSSTLSWLEVFRGCVHEVVFCSLRRSLCYPLYRHWKLSMAVLQDVRHLFRLGRRKLLQCVLDVRDVLNSCAPYYILNNLYLTDYAIWLQSASIRQVQRLADELDEVTVEMGSMGWGLVELEEAALLTVEEEEEAALRGAHPRTGTPHVTVQEEEALRGAQPRTGTPHQEMGAEDGLSFQPEDAIRLIADQLQATSLTETGKPLIEELQVVKTDSSSCGSGPSSSSEDSTTSGSEAATECETTGSDGRESESSENESSENKYSENKSSENETSENKNESLGTTVN